jgi:prophage tail gpP-like protein
MPTEQIKVMVGGEEFTSWEQVTVRAAFDEAVRAFSLVAALQLGAAETHQLFAIGTEIQIFTNEDLLLDGYVDKRKAKLDEDSRGITISGRSKSADLVDSSAVHDTGNFENVDPVAIGNGVATGMSATFVTDQALDAIESYRLTPGSTVIGVIEQLTRDQGMTLKGLANGNVMITKAGTARQAGGLYEGVNILSAESDHDGSNRHSKITVLGQSDDGTGDDALEIEGTATDSKVTRFRPHIMVHHESTTKAFVKQRAATRRDRAAGRALKSEVEMQGFRDEDGEIFEPGNLIWTESETLGIAQDMLIESIELTQHFKNGTKASLSLVDPRTYGGSKGKGNQSSEDNDLDDSDAE